MSERLCRDFDLLSRYAAKKNLSQEGGDLAVGVGGDGPICSIWTRAGGGGERFIVGRTPARCGTAGWGADSGRWSVSYGGIHNVTCPLSKIFSGPGHGKRPVGGGPDGCCAWGVGGGYELRGGGVTVSGSECGQRAAGLLSGSWVGSTARALPLGLVGCSVSHRHRPAGGWRSRASAGLRGDEPATHVGEQAQA